MLILCNDARCKIRKIDMPLNLCAKEEENIMFGCWCIVGQNFGQRKVSEEVIYSILGEEGQRLLSRNTRHCLEYVLKHSKRSLEPYETLQILPRQKYDCAINAVFCYASPLPLTVQRIQKERSMFQDFLINQNQLFTPIEESRGGWRELPVWAV